ncbi:gamma-glutamyl hydrolase-like [Acropora millepora]|uniref:gamma-glutamyl hydrolase-like n=1 Tax=Acropora millepora TaxID=45264 RepID=UPI001CF12DE4|nr:gamma-glutamyl hydrolase-like [Acropora millepora]
MTNFKPKALVFFFILLKCSEEITMDLFSESFEYDDDEKTERPIVGVLTQETDGNVTIFGSQYVAASYVKFIESAGGRMVPIFINSTEKEVEKLFNSLNGALFPGGHRHLQHTNYTRVGKQIFDLALKAFANGDVFPIWAECLGFELVSMLVSKADLSLGQFGTSLFTDVLAKNISLSLILPKDYIKAAMWKSAPPYIVRHLRNNPATYNNHKLGLTPETYNKNYPLKKFFRIVATSKDTRGVEFITMMEGKNHPIFMVHWHPLKAQFEWRGDLNISHSVRDVLAGQYFANFFMKQARRSGHRFPSEKEENANLIYKYKPTDVRDYMLVIQAYFF